MKDLLEELYCQMKQLKDTNIIDMTVITNLQKNIYKVFETKPYYISCSLKLNSLKIRDKEMKEWNKNESLNGIYYLSDDSFKHTNVHMFYKKDDLIEEIDSLEDDTYILLGIEKPFHSGNPKVDKMFEDTKFSTWEILNSVKKLKEVFNNLRNEDIHLFKMSDDVSIEIMDKYRKAEEICDYLTERNCFDTAENADNSGKYKVKMKGDIIITDPCYLIRKRDESTRPKWENFHPYNSIYEYPDYDEKIQKSKMFERNSKLLDEADEKWCKEHPEDRDSWNEVDLSNFGFTSYITHNTLYGDWGCHTYKTENHEVLGEFCADGGKVGVFLLDEVLAYNPDFDYHIERPWTTTLIKNFDGEVYFEKLDSETLTVKGNGNVNFFTSQTSL